MKKNLKFVPILFAASIPLIMAPSLSSCKDKSFSVTLNESASKQGVYIKHSTLAVNKDSEIELGGIPAIRKISTAQIQIDGTEVPQEDINVVESMIYIKAAGIKNAGKVNLHVELTDQKVLFEVKIKSLPEITSFKDGEKFTAKGLVLHASYYDGSEEDITDGFKTSLPEGYVFTESDIRDDYEITVKYGWKQTKYWIKVLPASLDKITIHQAASQTIFKVGEGFQAVGLTIDGHYSNGKVKEITDDFAISYGPDKQFTEADVGDQTVTISYKGKTTEYHIKVVNVLLETVDIVQKPKKLQFKVGEKYSTEGIGIKSSWSDGSEIIIHSRPYYTTKIDQTEIAEGQELTSVGLKQVEVEVDDGETNAKRTTSYYIEVSPATVTKIEIDSAGKTEFKVGEDFTSNGLKINATYSDGSKKEHISEGFTTNWDGKQFKKEGTETVTVYYEGASCTYTVTVKPATVTKLTINTPPSKQSFKVGETFTSAGLTLNATYSDGTTKIIKSGFTTDLDGHKFEFSDIGERNVTVTFDGWTVSYSIKITPATLIAVKIKTKPTQTTFRVGDIFNCDGLVLVGHYSDGTNQDIKSGFTTNFDKRQFTQTDKGTKQVVVTYQNFTDTYDIKIEDASLQSIKITTEPTKKEYKAGEALDNTGLVLEGHYSDGTNRPITSGFVTEPENGYIFKQADVGQKTIIVKYGGQTASFAVTVAQPTLESIAVTKNPVKMIFEVGQSFDTTGMEITATYSDQSTVVIKSGFTTDYDGKKFTTSDVGSQKPVTVTYEGKTTEYKIDVIAAKLEKITIATPASKLTFKVGETFTSKDLVLLLQYTDGTTKLTEQDYTTNWDGHKFESKDLGPQGVTVTYTEAGVTKTTAYGISVTKATLESIEVKKDVSTHRTSFRAGETFTSSGLKLLATYSDESTETISSGWTTSLDGQKFTREQVGKQLNCLVRYQGKTTSYNVTITKAGLEKLEFKSKPSKLTYKVGEKFTTEGMVLNATYSDGVTKEITSGWSTEPWNEGHKFYEEDIGDKDITVSYTEGDIKLSVKYQIIITAATLESISVKKLPTKTTFVAGDKFTREGMVLNCHFSDGTTKTVENGFTTNFDGHTFTKDDVGNKTVTVTHCGKTTTYDIKVSPAVVTNVVVNYERSHLKVKYSPGQKFTSDGLVLTLTYSDGTTQDVTDGYTTNHDGYVFSKQDGTAPILITIKYKDFAPRIDGYYVWVLIPKSFKISPHSQHRTMFEIGEKFWHQGLKILVTNNDGSQYETSENIKSNIDGSIFQYGDKEMSIDITYSDITMYGIYKVNVNKPLFFEVHQRSSHRTKFKVGETFNHKGLVLLVTFTDHSIREVAEGFKTNLDGYKFNDMDRGKTKTVNIVLPDGEVFLYAIEVE